MGWKGDIGRASLAATWGRRRDMRTLVGAYDRYLKAKAQAVCPAERQRVVHAATFPWCLPPLFASLMVILFQLPRDVQGWLILPAAFVAVLGASYAGWRITKHGWEYDRTPPTAAWTETEAGEALIHALRRVTLNGLSKVTGSTRLRADLGLTSADMSELFSILVADGWLDQQAPRITQLDLSVDALISRMSPA